MTNKSDTPANYFVSRRALLASGLATGLMLAGMPLAAFAKPAKPAAPSANAPDTNSKPGNAALPGRPDVYLLRGFANIFSAGIDEICADLQAMPRGGSSPTGSLPTGRNTARSRSFSSAIRWAPMPLFPSRKSLRKKGFAWITWRRLPQRRPIPYPEISAAS